MIRELEAEGRLGKRGRKGFSEAGALPPVGVADVIERDGDGELYVRLVEAGADAPRALLMPDKAKPGPAPGLGDRLLVKFQRGDDGWEARLIKRLDAGTNRVLGVIRKSNREIRVEPVDRKSKESLVLAYADGEKVNRPQDICADHGLEHIQLQMPLKPADCHRLMIADDLRRDHRQHLALRRVDLARHD